MFEESTKGKNEMGRVEVVVVINFHNKDAYGIGCREVKVEVENTWPACAEPDSISIKYQLKLGIARPTTLYMLLGSYLCIASMVVSSKLLLLELLLLPGNVKLFTLLHAFI